METCSILLRLGLIIGVIATFARAGDPDPVDDFQQVDSNATDSSKLAGARFMLKDMFTNGDVTHGPGGVRAGLNADLFPTIAGQSLTYVQFKMKPCGVNLPHTHPRATEMLTLIGGGPLQVGFVDTQGKAHIDVLDAGDVTIFPRGLMHYELNVGTEEAHFISALNSQNPGTLTSASALFQLPKRALATAINQDMAAVEKLESNMFQYSHELKLATTCEPGKDITTHL